MERNEDTHLNHTRSARCIVTVAVPIIVGKIRFCSWIDSSI